jgi:hypothetical protein
MNENENVEDETQKIAGYALEDLQKYLATAGASTTEQELLAWQNGYITGVNRAMGISL